MTQVPAGQTDPPTQGPSPRGQRDSGQSFLRDLLNKAPMRYPNAYVWLVFVSSMDLMLTHVILNYLGGIEVNPVARYIIDRWDKPGAIAFKFGLMIFVILVCELVGRYNDRQGRWLARVAVILSAVPVAYSLWLMTYHFAITGSTVVGG